MSCQSIHNAIVVTCFSLGLTSGVALSASYDCQKATTYSEKLICSEGQASKLDDEISVLYKNLVLSDGNRVKKDQSKWLGLRNSCSEKECVYRLLEQRKSEMLAGAERFASYVGVTDSIRHNIVVGLDSEGLVYVRFLSIAKMESDCNFVLNREGHTLNTENGYKISSMKTSDGYLIDFTSVRSNANVVSTMCGRFATLPQKLYIKGINVQVRY